VVHSEAVVTIKIADLEEVQEALKELALLKPVLAQAISKLPKQQLKLSLKEQATIGELALQMKHEEKSGAILFRAVKA
jgi:hypothetical protein